MKKKTKKKAFITGINGQDGSYLAEQLLDKGFEVHGMLRRSSYFNTGRIEHLYPVHKDKDLFLHYGDLTDGSNISRLMEKIQPNWIFNTGAMSHVAISFEVPEYAAQTDGIGVLRLLDAMRAVCPKARFLQCSTSELFGKVLETPQKETTPFNPQSPYSAAKAFAFFVCKNYREAYNLYICNSICFNHEGTRRSENFITRKISLATAKIKLGVQNKLKLGNLAAMRDWGLASEYTLAMIKMLEQDKPDDYCIATGEAHSVEEFCLAAFDRVDMPLEFRGEGIDRKGYDEDGIVRVEVDPKYFRPTEVDFLLGDASKAKRVLGWEPTVTFKELVEIMTDSDLELVRKQIAAGNYVAI